MPDVNCKTLASALMKKTLTQKNKWIKLFLQHQLFIPEVSTIVNLKKHPYAVNQFII